MEFKNKRCTCKMNCLVMFFKSETWDWIKLWMEVAFWFLVFVGLMAGFYYGDPAR